MAMGKVRENLFRITAKKLNPKPAQATQRCGAQFGGRKPDPGAIHGDRIVT